MDSAKDNSIVMSRFAFERMQLKDERNDFFRNLTIIILIILLVVTNAMWLIAWSQYDYVDDYSVDVNASDGGNANYIGNDGDINNGTDNNSSSQSESTP